MKTLETFNQRCLRKMLHIRWEDRRTNASVLTEVNTTSVLTEANTTSVLTEVNTTSVLTEVNTTSVLTEVNTTSVEAMIWQNQLLWTGHCVRMPDSRLPRQVLFSQLTHGLRTRGGPRKRFKDTAKHYMKKGHININTWEDRAADRLRWRPQHPPGSGPLRV